MADNDPELDRHLQANQAYIKRQIERQIDDLVLAQESVSDLMQSISRELIEENSDFEYRTEGEFKAWLKHVVKTKIVDRHRFYTAQRRDARRDAPLPTTGAADSATPSLMAMREEERQQVTEALQRLPEDYQTVLRLFWFEGLPHEAIAAHMGRPETATRKLLSRAKARMGIEMSQLKKLE
jgi:RNA polymerase sigma-70 factor (ECF subfamily)